MEDRILLAESPAAELWLDDEGRIGYGSVAAAALFAGLVDELQGKRFIDFLDGAHPRFAQWQDWLAEPRPEVCDCRLLLAAGPAWVQLRGRRLLSPPGGLRLSIAVRPPLEEDQRLRDFAAAVAHDFNNVLGSLSIFAQLLQGSGLGPEQTLFVDHLLAACRLGQNFTANLQVLSGRRRPRPAVLDLAAVVRGLEPILRVMLAEGYEFSLEVASGLEPVLAEQFLVEQALLNLVQNGREAMTAGGRLAVAVRRVTVAAPQEGPLGTVPAGAYPAVIVADQGKGIPPEHRRRIFATDYTTKDSKADIGLGLWVVARIVAMSGGYLLLDTAPEQGATFQLLFTPAPS